MQYDTTDDPGQAFDAQFDFSVDTNGLTPSTSTRTCAVDCWTTNRF